MNAKYTHVGIHTGPNDKYTSLTAIVFAGRKAVKVVPSHRSLKSTVTDFDNKNTQELKNNHEKVVDHLAPELSDMQKILVKNSDPK